MRFLVFCLTGLIFITSTDFSAQAQRPDRGERSERPDRGERSERPDRGERGDDRSNRPDDRSNRPDNRRERTDWVVLGEQRARQGVSDLVIEVGRREGLFDAVKVRIEDGNILLVGVRITFGNGETEDLRVGAPLPAGSETSPIEFEGRGRVIRSITVRYGSLGIFGRPKIIVFGSEARRPEPDRFRPLGRDWEQLGSLDVGRRPDREILSVGRREGRFDGIILRVRGNDVAFRRVVVRYANGETEELDVDRVIRAGEQSDLIQLRGRTGRFIDRIEFIYRAAGAGRREANLEVWGRKLDRAGGRFRPLGPNWDQLAKQEVGRRGDRDVIELGRRAGRFDALLIRVRREDVAFRRVRVVYGNNQSDELDVDRIIEAGDESDILELRGRAGRVINRIELIYRAVGTRRPAEVEVWGRKSSR
jgi:hypothetical protein